MTLEIKNRLFPDFREVTSTRMNKREQIGDTDYFFEVIEFYPHFAYVDSSKQIVSLSDEPRNVAFKIAVYELDEVAEHTWAFFNISVPHYSRTSVITFDVIDFDYRGVHHAKGEEKTAE